MKITFFPNLDHPARIFLGCLLLLILIVPFDEGGNGYIAQAYTQSLLLICAAVWGVHTVRQKELRLSVDPLDWIVSASILCVCINSFLSVYRYAALLELIKICSYAAAFYLCRRLFPLHKLRQVLLCAIFGSSVLQMAIAWGLYLSRQRPFLQADFVNPNNFACFLVFGVNVGMSFLLFAFSQDSPRHSKKSAALLRMTIGTLVCCLVWTILHEGSRGAALSLLGSGFFVCSLKKRRLVFLFLILCGFALFLPISGSSIFERLQKRSDRFAYERVGIWKSSLKMASEHPFSGVGLGQFEYAAPAYNFPVEQSVARYGKNINSAHNDILQIFAELGIPGLGLFLGGLGLILFYAIRRFRRHPLAWTDVAAVTVLLGFMIQSSFSYLMASPALAFIVTLVCVLILDAKQSQPPKILTFHASKLRSLLVLLLAVYIFMYAIAYPLLGHRQSLHYSRFIQEKNILRAVPHLQSAIDYVPIHPGYYYRLGTLYMDLFKKAPKLDVFEKARNALDAAVQYHSRNYKYYETRGILYKELFHSLSPQTATAEKALREYELALQYNPFNPFLLFSKAMVHADIDQFDLALDLLQQAVTVEPNFVGGHQMLGKMLTHLGREAEAETAVQRAEEIQRRYAARATESHYIYSLLRALK
ncbi:MAG: hypothetical protein GY801_53095 [bacterium]|nr:hypothetical protein [bacterium]